MRAGDGSWVGQSMISVTLSSMIFEEKDTCLTSVTEVSSPPADASHVSTLLYPLLCCLVTSGILQLQFP